MGLKVHLYVPRRKIRCFEVTMANLDLCTNIEDKIELYGEVRPIVLGKSGHQMTMVVKDLEGEGEVERCLIRILRNISKPLLLGQ